MKAAGASVPGGPTKPCPFGSFRYARNPSRCRSSRWARSRRCRPSRSGAASTASSCACSSRRASTSRPGSCSPKSIRGPSQAALTQAEGQLGENQARLRNAQSDLATFQRLANDGLITKQQVTTQEALVDQYRGALQAIEAQVNNAKVQLSYTRILAPIGGRLGLRQVDSGNLIRSGDTNGLVVITMMKPISVLFTIPETDLPAVLEAYRRGHRLRVQAWDRAETRQLAEGELRTVDNQIDTTTGTIKLRAEFANENEDLFPNQFVNIRLRVDSIPDASVIPSAAVQRGSFGTFVYLVKDDKTVTVRRVGLGPAQGTRIAIANGLKPGDRVVLEGVDQLKEGAKVEVIPDAPADASAPAPAHRPASGGARAR